MGGNIVENNFSHIHILKDCIIDRKDNVILCTFEKKRYKNVYKYTADRVPGVFNTKDEIRDRIINLLKEDRFSLTV